MMWFAIVYTLLLVNAVESGKNKTKNKCEPILTLPSYDVAKQCLECYERAIPDQVKYCRADFVFKIKLLDHDSQGNQYHIRGNVSEVFKYKHLSKKKMKAMVNTEQTLVTYEDVYDNCAMLRCDGSMIEIDKEYYISGRFVTKEKKQSKKKKKNGSVTEEKESKKKKKPSTLLLLDLCHSLCIPSSQVTAVQIQNLKSGYSKVCEDGAENFCEVDFRATTLDDKTDCNCLTYCFDCYNEYSICEKDKKGICNWRPISSKARAYCAGVGELPIGYMGHN